MKMEPQPVPVNQSTTKMQYVKGYTINDLEHLKNYYGMGNTISRINIARALKVSTNTVGKWTDKGLLQKHIINGNTKYPVYYVKEVYSALKKELNAQEIKGLFGR
jgi:hypothetical protein